MGIAKIQEKIQSLEALSDIVKGLKQKGETIVFTNGCFDIVHPGHIHTLSEAKYLGTKLIVGINSDSSVKKLKGDTRPIQNEDQRALTIAAFSFVDYVVLFENETPIKLIETLIPNILVKGGDYKIDEIVGADIVLKNGGKVEMIPFLKGFSTTNTIG
ncbi:MAG: D-glycero-beta-D-manno-heptose 1-phosphate adenylyltransferase, partial [Chitinophagales bacterium]